MPNLEQGGPECFIMCSNIYIVEFTYDGNRYTTSIDSTTIQPKSKDDKTLIWGVAYEAIKQKMKTIEKKEGISPCYISIFACTKGKCEGELDAIRDEY